MQARLMQAPARGTWHREPQTKMTTNENDHK